MRLLILVTRFVHRVVLAKAVGPCLLMGALITAAIAPVHATDPRPTFLITGTQVWSDETIILREPLTVAPGANLTLQRVHLIIETGGEILIAAGGTLHVHDTHLQRGADAPYYPLLVSGRLDVAQSHIEGSEGLILRGTGTIGSRIHASVLSDNRDHGAQLTLRAALHLSETLIVGNGHDAITAPAGVRVSDATLIATDNVFRDNAAWSIRLVSTTAGAQALGPSVSRITGNVFADGDGGIHIQDGDPRSHHIEGNLFTALKRGMNLQGPGHATLTKNTIIGNDVAISNFGHVGTTTPLNAITDHTLHLGDSWLGPAGAVWEGPNRLHGPFDVTALADEDPVPHLWEGLEAARGEASE